MKTKILTLLFLAIAQCVFAQEEPVSYEWLEKQSKIISDLQYKTSGQNGRNYAKDHFTVYYNDKKASYSYTHTVNNTEYTTVIEDVDFSKATGLDIEDNIVYVAFPDHSITEQVYGGKEYQYVKTGLLAFYTNSKDDRAKMLFELYHIITELKIDKGLITRTDAIKQWKDYKELKPYEFYKKYPKSILAYEGKLLEEDYERANNYYSMLLDRYESPGYHMKVWTFEDDKRIKKLVKAHRRKYNFSLLPFKYYIGNQTFFANYFTAQTSYYYPDESRINSIQYTILVTKDKDEAIKKSEELKEEFLQNIEANLIIKNVDTKGFQFGKLYEDEDSFLNHDKEAKNSVFIEVDFSKETRFGKFVVDKEREIWSKTNASLHTFNYKHETYYTVAICFFKD